MGIRADAHLAELRKIGAPLLDLFVFRGHSSKSYRTGRPENGSSGMLDEGCFRKAFLRVAKRGVQRTPAFVSVRPDDGMVWRHRSAAVRALVQRGEHGDVAARISTEVVPLIATRPRTRKHVD